MHVYTALFTLAHRHCDVRLACRCCGHGYFLAIDDLVIQYGPMYPVTRVAKGTSCRKCGARDMEARPG